MARVYEDNSRSIGNTILVRINRITAGKLIVVILPDAGERYLSTVLFEGIDT